MLNQNSLQFNFNFLFVQNIIFKYRRQKVWIKPQYCQQHQNIFIKNYRLDNNFSSNHVLCEIYGKIFWLRKTYYSWMLGTQISREGWDPINQLSPATCLCLSHDRTWISNTIYHGFCVYVQVGGDCSFCWYW